MVLGVVSIVTGSPSSGATETAFPLIRSIVPRDRKEALIGWRSSRGRRRVEIAARYDHHVGTRRSHVAGIYDARTDDIHPASVPIPPAPSPAVVVSPTAVVCPTMVVTPTVVVAPTMSIVSVVMAPRRVMPGKAPAVQAGVAMCQSASGPAPMMSRTRGRVGMPAVCVSAVPMPAMPVRSMSAVSVPAVAAACEGRGLVHLRRADHRCQRNQAQTFHRQGPLSECPSRAVGAFKPFEQFGHLPRLNSIADSPPALSRRPRVRQIIRPE